MQKKNLELSSVYLAKKNYLLIFVEMWYEHVLDQFYEIHQMFKRNKMKVWSFVPGRSCWTFSDSCLTKSSGSLTTSCEQSNHYFHLICVACVKWLVLMYTNFLNCNLLHCEHIPPPTKASWHIYYNPQCWGCVEKLVLQSSRNEVGKWADTRVYDNVNRPGLNIWCIFTLLQMPFVPKETVYLQYSERKAHKSYVYLKNYSKITI